MRADPRPIPLLDGRSVLVRPIRPGDRAGLRALLDDLRPASRRARFLGSVARVGPRTLRRLVDVDHVDHEALVAVDPASSRLVGDGRFVRRREDPVTAELAVAVADDWQSDGVGTVLVALLADRARELGIERFVGSTLRENRPMHELVRELGRPELRGWRGVDDFDVALPEGSMAERIPELLAGLRARRPPRP